MFATVIFILILSFLVIIHELGHYFAARWAKIKVEEFGLGYPPKAITLFTYKGTPFTINWIPFGGFVKMEGEDGTDSIIEDTSADLDKKSSESAKTATASKKKKLSSVQEGPFYTKSAWQRMVVILAGVVVNFLFGVIAFAIVYSFLGIPTLIDQARIESVATDSPAALAGVPSNVNVIAIRDGSETIAITDNATGSEAVKARLGKSVVVITTGPCDGLSCQESAQEFPVYIRAEAETPEDQGPLGIRFAGQVFVHYPWYEQIIRGIAVGVEQAVLLGVFILVSLFTIVKQLFQLGQVPTDIAGPVGIVHQAQSQGIFTQGPLMILNFTGLLSVNLAVMNLLPIPALDGGRALFIVLEKFVGRARVQKIEGYANYGGFILLLGLILAVTIRDVWRIFV